MCGIIGVISKENTDELGALIAHGLYQVQNRGDYSAGIAVVKKLPVSRKTYRKLREIAVDHTYEDFEPLAVEKGFGRVHDVFTEDKISRLHGFMGIGKVRYPTAGYTYKKDHESISKKEQEQMKQACIEPLRTVRGRISLVHNGDVNNYSEIMQHFNRMGIRQAGNSDAEAILNVFSEEFYDLSENMSDSEKVERTVKNVFEKVKGTYSVVTIINNVGFVAFRDPQGRRPLFFGVRANGEIKEYAFASETVALEKMLFDGTKEETYETGRKMYDEVKPGEMIFISKDFVCTRIQVAESKLTLCPFEAAYFMRASSYLNNRRVKSIRYKIIELMWQRFQKEDPNTYTMLVNGDSTICPVPRTAESAAIHLGNITGMRYIVGIEKHPFSPRIFLQPTQKHRDVGTIADHYIFEEEITGKNIIIIDDSIVRGTTLKHDITYLRSVGAKSIHIFITFPEIKHPCNHAIDFHTAEELFAHNKDLTAMKKGLGLHDDETLVFCTPDELSQAIGLSKEKLCNECYKK